MPPIAPPPDPPTIRVLLVDDDEDDFLLARDLLAEIPDTRFALDWVADPRQGILAILRSEHDLCLIDYRLGPINGIDLIREARRQDRQVPMILLTGVSDRVLDFEAMKAGASDFLEKGNLTASRLERSIRYSLQQRRHATELERKVRERTLELARANETLHAEVAERKRVEAALRHVDRRKDEFLATLAHELRNPLAPIRNALEIMRLAPDRPGVIESNRAMIERQVRQMVRLIDDLLDISRISRGKIELRKERVLLRDVIDSAVESARALIEAGEHELTIDMPQEPIRLDADATRLSQVVLNLLNNAAKYTPTGGRIHLSAREARGIVAIAVKDNGVGIEAEHLPHVFEMFAQIHRHPDHAHGGLGIGLSLVKNLVHLHGGRVEVRSEGAGKGSEFTIRLPARAPELDETAERPVLA